MSRSRTSAVHPRPGGSAGGLAAALTGLALLAACGTAQAGAVAPAASAPSDVSSGSAATSRSVVTSGSTVPTTNPTTDPTTDPTTAVDLDRVPLVLPSAGRVTGVVTGTVSGIVTLGFDQCLFLRTDAGQRFGLEGPLAKQVRTLIIGRGVPVPQGRDSSQGDSAPTELPGAASVRITAQGTVTTGASVCSASYQFTAASGRVVSAVSRTLP